MVSIGYNATTNGRLAKVVALRASQLRAPSGPGSSRARFRLFKRHAKEGGYLLGDFQIWALAEGAEVIKNPMTAEGGVSTGTQKAAKAKTENIVGVCPDCGSALWHVEGCMVCKSCGYSKCG